jgi:hypothetical protein
MPVERNEDGSFVATLLPIDGHSRNGVFIPRETVEKQMKSWNAVGMRAELNHPYQWPGESKDEFDRRCNTISMERVCCELRQFRIEEVEGKPQLTAAVVLYKTPCGNIFEKILDESPDAWRFGMRALTRMEYIDGIPRARLEGIVTFDVIANG